MFSRRSRKSRYRVAIEGFSDFERAALASFFRLTERRVPGYLHVATPDDSDFLIADADQARVLAWVARERRIGETVFIGEQAPDTALAWLTRPIESDALMRALDSLLGAWTRTKSTQRSADERTQRGRQPSAGAVDERSRTSEPFAASDLEEANAAAGATAIATARGREPTLSTALAFSGDGGRDAGVSGGGRRVLIAGIASNARDVLARRLDGLGYRVSVAGSSEEALEYAAWTAFPIAFLDLDLKHRGGLDSLQLCQQLKRLDAGDAPAVVITTEGRGGATDQVRATLAGCDIYLSKPLLDADLTDVLRRVDPSFSARRTAEDR